MKDFNNLVKDINKNIGEIEIGVIKSKTRMLPSKGTKSFAGGVARKLGKTNKEITNASLLENLENRYGLITKSFNNTKEVKDFLNNILLGTLTTKNNSNNIVNSFKALIVKPILKGKYGSNKPITIKRKGFNRFGIDTGQLIKNLQCKIGNKNYE
jgi:hypothetical protein